MIMGILQNTYEMQLMQWNIIHSYSGIEIKVPTMHMGHFSSMLFIQLGLSQELTHLSNKNKVNIF